jgi:hypothetical protein
VCPEPMEKQLPWAFAFKPRTALSDQLVRIGRAAERPRTPHTVKRANTVKQAISFHPLRS